MVAEVVAVVVVAVVVVAEGAAVRHHRDAVEGRQELAWPVYFAVAVIGGICY